MSKLGRDTVERRGHVIIVTDTFKDSLTVEVFREDGGVTFLMKARSPEFTGVAIDRDTFMEFLTALRDLVADQQV